MSLKDLVSALIQLAGQWGKQLSMGDRTTERVP